ncbi:MAG: hypothetical protein LGB62_07880 [Sulfurovum sp.]|nr:hypothetical protein [Sulfurovum sp.]
MPRKPRIDLAGYHHDKLFSSAYRNRDGKSLFLYETYKWKLDFLSEKTFNEATDKENFTHAKLVSAYRSLRTNLPYLFTYKKYKHLGIHNTTNSLDGGVFSPMKMLIKIHRGLSKSLKLKMVDDYLVRDKKK